MMVTLSKAYTIYTCLNLYAKYNEFFILDLRTSNKLGSFDNNIVFSYGYSYERGQVSLGSCLKEPL